MEFRNRITHYTTPPALRGQGKRLCRYTPRGTVPERPKKPEIQVFREGTEPGETWFGSFVRIFSIFIVVFVVASLLIQWGRFVYH